VTPDRLTLDGSWVNAAPALPLGHLDLRLTELSVVVLELLAPEDTLKLLRAEAAEQRLPRAVPKRQAEFAAGRHAARFALAAIDVRGPVVRGEDAAPRWPSGAVGSISHGAGIAVAAVARTSTHRGVGIDVERVVTRDTHAELIARVAAPQELVVLTRALPEVSNELLFSLIFSAKESLFKCLFPLAQVFFGFEDAVLQAARLTGPQHATLRFELLRALSSEFPANTTLEARCYFEATRVVSAVTLEQR
jgi:enterobactin synthetase component D